MQHVEVKVVENVATIVMDRPQAHNALSEGLINDLNQKVITQIVAEAFESRNEEEIKKVRKLTEKIQLFTKEK